MSDKHNHSTTSQLTVFSLWRPSVAHSNPAAKVMLILRWCDNCTDVEQDEKLRELRDPPDLELWGWADLPLSSLRMPSLLEATELLELCSWCLRWDRESFVREALQVVLSKRFLLRKSQSYASQSVQLLKCSNIQLFKSNNPDDDEVEVKEYLFFTKACADSEPDVVRCWTADCTVTLAAVLCIPADTASLSFALSLCLQLFVVVCFSSHTGRTWAWFSLGHFNSLYSFQPLWKTSVSLYLVWLHLAVQWACVFISFSFSASSSSAAALFAFFMVANRFVVH